MYVSSSRHPFGRYLSKNAARGLVVLVYSLYPLGCLLRLTAESALQALAGLAAVTLSLLAFAVLAESSLQRQAQEREALLDERELAERNRAAFLAYSLFSGVVLIGLLYLYIGADFVSRGKVHLWLPNEASHWEAIFVGLLVLSLTLPTAVLAWTRTESLDGDKG